MLVHNSFTPEVDVSNATQNLTTHLKPFAVQAIFSRALRIESFFYVIIFYRFLIKLFV